MKQGLTEIVVVLDRSGWFDTFIAEQRKLPGEARVTLTQFDTRYDIVYEGKTLAEVPPLVLEPRDMTALHDAVGRTIEATGRRLAALPDEERPERVLVVVITDGGENASTDFTGARVAEMVKHQTEKYSWQFVYIGANQDAIANAAAMNINVASNFQANAAGTSDMFGGVTRGVTSYRSGGGYQQ